MENSRKTRGYIWAASVGIALLILILGVITARALVTGDEGKRKHQIQMVMLIKPPPPKIEEVPPEPEVKKEEIVEETPLELPQDEMEASATDEAPAGDQLGLDALGTSGSDDFGLLAKKGGRPLLGGSDGLDSLLRQYAWYNSLVETEIQRALRELLAQKGQRFEKDMQAEVELRLNDWGHIVAYAIRKSSGDKTLDGLVEEALESARINEMKPSGMPPGIRIVVSSRG